MADDDPPQGGLPLVIRNTFWELKEDGAVNPDEGARKFHTAPPGGNSPVTATATEPVKIVQLVSITEEHAVEPDDAARAGEPEMDDGAKTTVMLRNLPTHLERDCVLAILDSEGFFGVYDFFYLPIDFATMHNFGYCFINLVNPEVTQQFWVHFDGYCKWGEPGDSVVVSWSAKHQGLAQNVERFRNCPVMFDKLADACRPILLQHGVRVPFPPPTRRLRQPRVRAKKGSRDEAGPECPTAEEASSPEVALRNLRQRPACTEPAYV